MRRPFSFIGGRRPLVVVVITRRIVCRLTLVIDASASVVSSMVLLAPATRCRQSAPAPLNVLERSTVWQRRVVACLLRLTSRLGAPLPEKTFCATERVTAIERQVIVTAFAAS